MPEPWPVHPWVAAHREHPGFALQPFPLDTKEAPVTGMLAAGKRATDA